VFQQVRRTGLTADFIDSARPLSNVKGNRRAQAPLKKQDPYPVVQREFQDAAFKIILCCRYGLQQENQKDDRNEEVEFSNHIGLLFWFQQGIHLNKRVKDTDDTHKDYQTGREKGHDEVKRICEAIGGDERLHTKDEKEDGQNRYDCLFKPPEVIIHKRQNERFGSSLKNISQPVNQMFIINLFFITIFSFFCQDILVSRFRS
jgi:hypothetical protein